MSNRFKPGDLIIDTVHDNETMLVIEIEDDSARDHSIIVVSQYGMFRFLAENLEYHVTMCRFKHVEL